MFDFASVQVIDKNFILSKLSHSDILAYYCPNTSKDPSGFKYTVNCCLHDDKNPSLQVDLLKGRFTCFGCKKHGDGVEFVKQKYNVTFQEALNIINNDFKLAKTELIPDKFTSEFLGITIPDSIKKTSSISTKIQIKRRNWNLQDTYWSKYGINKELLDFYQVVPIQHYWVNGYLVYSYRPDNPAYSYEFGEGIRKILSPYSKDYKWMSNVPYTVYNGYDQLDWFGDKLIITSSMKDVIVLRLLGYNAIAPQGESDNIDSEFIEKLNKRFSNIYINYDNDVGKIFDNGKENPGQYFANKIIKKNPFIKNIVIPEKKDISDYVETFGIDRAKELMKELLSEI